MNGAIIRMVRPCVLLLLVCLTSAVMAQAVPNWAPNTSYSVGALVMYNGVEYRCIQAHTSLVGWEPAVVPALWQPVSGGGGASCTASPGAPGGLSASSTTSSSTVLSWGAVVPPANCSITNYTIYRNGAAVGTTGGTSVTISGLLPSTTYSFAVAASDSFGLSGQSVAISVTTPAGPGGGGPGCAAAWSSTQVYTAGMTASVNGLNYIANWWTQGQDPATNSGPSGSGQPWTSTGSCSACSAVPSAPTGLSASGTTGTSTILRWNPATVASNCSITSYTIFRNGTAVGSTGGTSFTVTGLSPSTTYNFAVSANSSAGTSPLSSAISVTTGTSPGGGGNKLFAPYIDMSLTPDQQIVSIQQQSGIQAFTLAFVVAAGGGCGVGWGGLGGTLPTDNLSNGTSILSLVQTLQAAGVKIIVSFGGATGTEPAVACTNVAQLQAAYQSVIDRYHVNMLDLDIEGGATTDQASITRRDQALKALKAANPGLIISYTLPVLPTGLIGSGVNILNSAKADGLAIDVVNVMAMDYGSANDNGGQMGLDATLAAAATHNQVLAAGLGATIGVTPMVGVNDTNTEIFQLSDANLLMNFANSNSYITRLAIWSVARDNGSCPGQGFASPICSGLSQGNYAFSQIFEAFR